MYDDRSAEYVGLLPVIVAHAPGHGGVLSPALKSELVVGQPLGPTELV